MNTVKLNSIEGETIVTEFDISTPLDVVVDQRSEWSIRVTDQSGKSCMIEFDGARPKK